MSVPVVFLIPIQSTDRRHFLIRQFKAEQIEIFFDVLRIGRAGDHYDTPLQIPPEDHLGRRYAMGFRDRPDRLIAKKLCRMPPAAQAVIEKSIVNRAIRPINLLILPLCILPSAKMPCYGPDCTYWPSLPHHLERHREAVHSPCSNRSSRKRTVFPSFLALPLIPITFIIRPLLYPSFSEKSASTSEILICCGHTCSQLRH